MRSILQVTTTTLTVTVALSLFASAALAEPLKLDNWNDDGNCDPLWLPYNVDELGRGFPKDELINTDTSTVNRSACVNDSPDIPNEKVLIINQTNREFTDLWYVADRETSLSNFDGVVNDQFAFHIDTKGDNRPLVSESIGANGIFEPGEAWEFIIDDYANSAGVGAWVIDSIGVPSPDLRSSGSIIAVPEPSSLCLVGLGLVGILGLRRERRTSAP